MVGIITAARAQIIIATCDDVPLDADDFDAVPGLGLPRVTVASRTDVPVIPTADNPVTIAFLFVRLTSVGTVGYEKIVNIG